MTHREIAALPLSVVSITYNWWKPVVDGIPAVAGYILPTLGAVLLLLQIAYYFKMLRK